MSQLTTHPSAAHRTYRASLARGNALLCDAHRVQRTADILPLSCTRLPNFRPVHGILSAYTGMRCLCIRRRLGCIYRSVSDDLRHTLASQVDAALLQPGEDLRINERIP